MVNDSDLIHTGLSERVHSLTAVCMCLKSCGAQPAAGSFALISPLRHVRGLSGPSSQTSVEY